MKAKSFSRVRLFTTSWTVAYQAHGPWDFPGRILEWATISFSRGSSQPRDRTGSPALQTDALPSKSHGKPDWLGSIDTVSQSVSSVAQSCPTLCDSMNRSMPGLPVHHHLPEFTQTHVHQVGDAIQPSHPLSSPFPPAPNLSQHQSQTAVVKFRS